MAIMLLSLTSCFRNYYNTRALPTVNENDLAMLQEKDRTVYVHFEDRPMLATGLSCRDGMLQGTLTALPNDSEPAPVAKHTVGLHKEHRSQIPKVVAQVHIFTRHVYSPADVNLTLPLVDIREVQYHKYNPGMSTLSHVGGVAGLIVALAATAGLVMLALDGNWGTMNFSGAF